jgi:hypothetical protein
MSDEKTTLSEKESLDLIASMINKAKNSYHDTGIGPMLWGAVIAVCSLVTYCEIKLDFKLPVDIWFLTLVAIIPQIYIGAKESKLKKVKTYDDRVMDYIWICFGISIFILSFINATIFQHLKPVFEQYVKATGSNPSFQFSSFSSSFFLLLYGFPTIITGGYRKFRPMLWGGILCWVCCVVSVFTNTQWDMLLMALSAVGAWLIPGIILWNKYQQGRKQHV